MWSGSHGDAVVYFQCVRRDHGTQKEEFVEDCSRAQNRCQEKCRSGIEGCGETRCEVFHGSLDRLVSDYCFLREA